MAERSIEEVSAGLEAATPEEPFLLTKSELIAHVESHDATGSEGIPRKTGSWTDTVILPGRSTRS